MLEATEGLRKRLENAKATLELTRYIDNTERMRIERTHYEGVVAELERRLREREASLREIL